jgi:CBS domain-containing protein
MREYEVGTVLVVNGNGANRALGIVTDRDIAIRCVAERIDPETTPVSQVMTAPVHSVDEQTPLKEAITRMAIAGTRRLIVTGEADRLVGILSLDDVLDLLVEEIEPIGRLLAKQQPHLPA